MPHIQLRSVEDLVALLRAIINDPNATDEQLATVDIKLDNSYFQLARDGQSYIRHEYFQDYEADQTLFDNILLKNIISSKAFRKALLTNTIPSVNEIVEVKNLFQCPIIYDNPGLIVQVEPHFHYDAVSLCTEFLRTKRNPITKREIDPSSIRINIAAQYLLQLFLARMQQPIINPIKEADEESLDTHKTPYALLKWILSNGLDRDPDDSNRTFLIKELRKIPLDIETIKTLINCNANIHYLDSMGSPLIYAINSRDERSTEIVQALLEIGANSNTIDPKRLFSPLIWAARFNKLDCANLLIQYGADINFKSPNKGYTALIMAILANHVEFAMFLLDMGANTTIEDAFFLSIERDLPILTQKILEKTDTERLFVSAFKRRNVPSIDWLVQYGARIQDHNQWDLTSFISIIDERTDLIEKLARAGYDINRQTIRNNQILEILIARKPSIIESLPNFEEKLNQLYALQDEMSLLSIAAILGKTNSLKKLLSLDANINTLSSKGQSALLLAIYFGQFESVKALIEAGADINLHEHAALQTPLIASMYSDNSNIFDYLLSQPTLDINHINGTGNTALQYAVHLINNTNVDSNRCLLIVCRILEKGNVNLENRNSEGHTALTDAISQKPSKLRNILIGLLLEKGAKPDIQYPGTDLSIREYCAMNGDHGIIRLLDHFIIPANVTSENEVNAAQPSPSRGTRFFQRMTTRVRVLREQEERSPDEPAAKITRTSHQPK